MRRDFLATLHCPYTGLPLLLSMDLDRNGEEINYGIASSEATDFPIVEGILRLHVDEYRKPIVEHVRAGRRSEALTVALDLGPFAYRTGVAINFASSFAFRTGFNSAAEQLKRLKRNFVRVVTDSNAKFAEIALKLTPGPMAHHQIYRFSMPGFLSTVPLVHMVRENGWVLSFACGPGHETFLISRMWPKAKIVCADYSFCSLYLAKRYFAPEASYVCLDGDYLLPFESGQFSTIFSSDTLPVLDSKLNLAQEFRRVGDERALTLLPHMHNRLVSPFAKSLTPRGYRQLFQDVELRMLPDDKVVRDYFFDDTLDLTREWSDEELSEQHVSMVASRDSSVFVRMENLWEQRMHSIRHPCVNPVYRIIGQPGRWELKHRAAERYAKTVTGTDKVCIPDTCRVTAGSLDAAGLIELQRTDPNQFAQLARSLVVLDLPERFAPESQVPQEGKGWATARQEAV
jgi:hypothetical protein